MAVILHLPTPLDRFRAEGDIIGRLVVEYGQLEWSLCLLAAYVTGDFDLAVKTMYRARGESLRLALGDALIRNRIRADLASVYEETFARLRDCLKIRNRYAHANWAISAGGGRGQLCYVDLEELANASRPASTGSLPLHRLDMPLIEKQATLFVQVAQNLEYMTWDAQAKAPRDDVHYVRNIAVPPPPPITPSD